MTRKKVPEVEEEKEDSLSKIQSALTKIIALEIILLIFLLILLNPELVKGELDIQDIASQVFSKLPALLIFVLIILIIKVMLDIIKPPFKNAVKRFSGSGTKADMLWRSLSHVIWIIVIIFLFFAIWAQTFDPAALVGIGVILAAVIYVNGTTISNFIAWIVIVTGGPYKIGDRIEINGKKGYIVDVTLMSTSMREFGGWMDGDTFTGRLISFPNNMIFTSEIQNYTKNSDYIYDEIDILITYESDYALTEKIMLDGALAILDYVKKDYKPILKEAIEVEELLDDFPTEPRIYWESKESGIKFSLIYLTPAQTRRDVKSALLRNILLTIQNEKRVNIAYPHMAVLKADDPVEKHGKGF